MNTRDICLHSGKTILFCIAIICGCGPALAAPSNTAAYVPVTDAMIQSPPPGDWLMWRRTQDSRGYSPLKAINRGNVNKLAQVWSRDLAPVFRAYDQETGKVLWEVNLGSQVSGFPITYSVDGRQYVAISTGMSLATAANLILAPELKQGSDNSLFVFVLQ